MEAAVEWVLEAPWEDLMTQVPPTRTHEELLRGMFIRLVRMSRMQRVTPAELLADGLTRQNLEVIEESPHEEILFLQEVQVIPMDAGHTLPAAPGNPPQQKQTRPTRPARGRSTGNTLPSSGAMGSDGKADKGKGKGPTLGGFAAYIPPAGGKPSGRDYNMGTFQSDYQPKGKGAKTGMPGSDYTNTDRKWEKSQRAREEAKTAKRDDLPSDDRTKGCLRDETGARRFRDKLHQQCFTEACEFLGYDVDDLHVMPEEGGVG
jgi:hypothetical protein